MPKNSSKSSWDLGWKGKEAHEKLGSFITQSHPSSLGWLARFGGSGTPATGTDVEDELPQPQKPDSPSPNLSV